MDDDDIFNSITGSVQPTQSINVPVTQHVQQVQKQDDDPFGLMSLNVGGNVQPPSPNTFVQQNNGFDMGLLGF
jgi:hypothetical protein